jgi:nucleoid DNA-binding protein
MEEKITFSQLCGLVAARSKMSRKTAEDFLRDLFALVSHSLEEGETVKLKGIGVFKVQKVGMRKSVDVTSGKEIRIPEHSKITFTPSKELAAAVNAPFEAFDAVEVSPSISDEELVDEQSDAVEEHNLQEELPVGVIVENIDSSVDNSPVDDSSVDSSSVDDTPFEKLSALEVDETPVVPEALAVPEIPTVPETPAVSESPTVLEVPDDSDKNIDSEMPGDSVSLDDSETMPDTDSESEADTPNSSRSALWIGILATISVLACVFIALLFLYPGVYSCLVGGAYDSSEPETEPQNVAVAAPTTDKAYEDERQLTDSLSSSENNGEVVADEKASLMPVTEASDATHTAIPATAKDASVPVYDTIGKTRYLTTMAKDHYGNFHFWPYIYKENASFLGHPDRIKPGTRVVVPPLSKYGVDPKNKKDEAEAKRLGLEIYAKYKK